MKPDHTGIILYTLNYKACVDFYSDILELPILFSTSDLTCFQFGNSYLMVEIDDTYNGRPVGNVRTKTCLRLNVDDVKAWSNRLDDLGIPNHYEEHSWGIITKFEDPDGNLIAFKDSKTFEDQVRKGIIRKDYTNE